MAGNISMVFDIYGVWSTLIVLGIGTVSLHPSQSF